MQDRIAAINRQVVTHCRDEQWEAAVSEAEKAHSLAEKHLPIDHPERAKALHNLAAVYGAIRGPEESIDLHRRAAEQMREAVGGEHPLYARTLGSLAGTLHGAGRLDEAEPLYVKALAILASAEESSVEHVEQLQEELSQLRQLRERALSTTPDEDASGTLGSAHFLRSTMAGEARLHLQDRRADAEAEAEADLAEQAVFFGDLSTHDKAMAILDGYRSRAEPFALYLRGFETEASDYLVEDPSYMTDQPGMRTWVNVWYGVSSVERELSTMLGGAIPIVGIANPADPDPSQGAPWPRLILPHQNWIVALENLIRRAHLILIDCMAVTPGVEVELGTIKRLGKAGNAVILLRRDRARFEAIREHVRAVVAVTGGKLAQEPVHDIATKEHPLIRSMPNVIYCEDLTGKEPQAFPGVRDLLATAGNLRRATNLAREATELAQDGDLPQAIDRFVEALRVGRDVPGWSERPKAFLNLGYLYATGEEWSSALEAFAACAESGQEFQDLQYVGRALSMMGDVFHSVGEHDQAASALTASLGPLSASDDRDYLVRSVRLLAMVYEETDELEKARVARAELQRIEAGEPWNRRAIEGSGLQ